MKKVELLAPAGSLEKAKIAFMYGADAVYAGTSKLSLRTRAEINSDTLADTIIYAHSIGKKVYVALNIYAMDEDYAEIESEVKGYYKAIPKTIHDFMSIFATYKDNIDNINNVYKNYLNYQY